MSTSPSSAPSGELSLFAAYLMERRHVSLLATDDGFITYNLDAKAGGCYIQDIYVRPEARARGLASSLTDAVADECRKAGIRKLYGTCVPSAPGSTVSMRAMLAYGFEVLEAQPDLIVLHKDI